MSQSPSPPSAQTPKLPDNLPKYSSQNTTASPFFPKPIPRSNHFAKVITTNKTDSPKVVHACTTLASAMAEFPPLCAGSLETLPSSGIGNNAVQPLCDRRVPKAIVFGGTMPDEDVAAVMEAVGAQTPGVMPVRVTRQDILDRGADTPNPGVISMVLHEKLGALVKEGRL